MSGLEVTQSVLKGQKRSRVEHNSAILDFPAFERRILVKENSNLRPKQANYTKKKYLQYLEKMV